MENQIVLFRLYTGEELIARLTLMENGDYFARNLTILIPTQSNSLGLAPFMPYTTIAETGVELKAKDVMFITSPVSELSDRYKEIHGDLITPPEKRIIL